MTTLLYLMACLMSRAPLINLAESRVKDMYFIDEAIPVEILPKIGALTPKVERLRRGLTGFSRGPS